MILAIVTTERDTDILHDTMWYLARLRYKLLLYLLFVICVGKKKVGWLILCSFVSDFENCKISQFTHNVQAQIWPENLLPEG
jgi:hypothetical protein